MLWNSHHFNLIKSAKITIKTITTIHRFYCSFEIQIHKMLEKKHIIDFRIRWAWHSISRLYNDRAKNHKATTSTAFAILNIEKEGTLSTQLGPKMGMESRSLTRTLKGMLDRGFIKKKIDPKDKRKVHLLLTKKGVEYRKIASENVKVFNERVFEKITEQELETFYKVMNAVDQSIEELKNEK